MFQNGVVLAVLVSRTFIAPNNYGSRSDHTSQIEVCIVPSVCLGLSMFPKPTLCPPITFNMVCSSCALYQIQPPSSLSLSLNKNIHGWQAAVLRSFRVFVEVCVLRRQPGYLPTTAAPELQLSNPASTPTRSSNQGGVSPARTPVGGASTSNRGAGGIAGLGGGGGDGGAGRDNAQKNSDFLGAYFVCSYV